MLARTALRRSTALLMVALVAALLVAAGGSVRPAQGRVNAGSGHTGSAPHSGRHVTSLPSASHDVVSTHLDLASTPPTDVPPRPRVRAGDVVADETSHVSGEFITPVGRGPPTV